MLPPFFYTALVPRNVPIYLVGMMGVGKSTVGARLASRLGCAFLDSDLEVERLAGRTIAEIFESDGAAHFRALEAEVIEAMAAQASVVALGGGAVVGPGAMDRLLATGEIVFLKADSELLIDRIGDATKRPLLAGLDRVQQIEKLEILLAERRPLYEQARIHVDARGSVEEVVDRIVSELAAQTGRVE